MVHWARKLAEKKPKQVAITALARKMAGILYAMWRDETAYSPTHQAKRNETANNPTHQLQQ